MKLEAALRNLEDLQRRTRASVSKPESPEVQPEEIRTEPEEIQTEVPAFQETKEEREQKEAREKEAAVAAAISAAHSAGFVPPASRYSLF